jgi:D-alanyl-D-alanine carboxypeptidase
MKKIISILLCTFIMISSFNLKVFAKDSPPEVSADNVVLMDGLTGEILYSKNPDAAYPPASTTKTMTALLTLENSKLDDKVIVGKNPPFAEGSKAGIREGEELTVRDLLYGLLFVSGNDCANALAEHIGGSIDNFVAMMNKRAKELGCENTSFINPNGLYNPNHKTSAKDLALIMKELVKHPEYSEIATDNNTYNIVAANTPDIKHPVSNEIKMAWKSGRYYYDGIEGGKTGYTVQSLHSYVVSAKRNNQRLIVAIVHSDSSAFYSDAIKLLNYGFKNFELSKLYSKGDVVSNYKVNDDLTIPLIAAEDFYYLKEKDSSNVPELKIKDKNLSDKPFSKGDAVLDADIVFNDRSIGTLKLESGTDHILKPVSAPNTPGKNVFSLILKILLGIATGFVMLILLLRTIIMRRRRKLRRNSGKPKYYSHYR